MFQEKRHKSAWSFKILITSLLEQHLRTTVLLVWKTKAWIIHDGKRVHEALELVGMQNFKREPARLSGGQKQELLLLA